MVSVVALVVAATTGHWGWTFALVYLTYALWQVDRFRRINEWLEGGIKLSQAPDASGLPGRVIHNIYRLKTSKKKGKKKLARLLGQFNASAAAMPDATLLLQADGTIDFMNDAAIELLGLDRQKDTQQRITNLVRDPRFVAYMDARSFDGDLVMPSPARPDVTLSLRVVPYAKSGLLLIARDISVQLQLERIRREFVANASHELRTPLTVVRGYLETMLDEQGLNASQRERVSMMFRQTDRMNQIIADMLTLSRLEKTELRADEGEDVHVSAIIEQVVEDITHSELATPGKIHVEVDRSLLLRGVEGDICSVCSNLLHNAVGHNPAATRIDLKWYLDPEGAPVLEVSDDGKGIEAHHLYRLTERFYRVDSGRSRDEGGTGLGLAIVKHAVQRHGGQLEIDSNPGAGSRFLCRFPVARAVVLEEAPAATL